MTALTLQFNYISNLIGFDATLTRFDVVYLVGLIKTATMGVPMKICSTDF